jgi:hypothetical protein
MDEPEEIQIVYVNFVDHADLFHCHLTEIDIPGAAIGSHNPCATSGNELKLWLKCRRISYAGLTKPNLVQAVITVKPMYNRNSLLEDPTFHYCH